MKLLILSQSGIPIYEQIETQLKEQILKRELAPNTLLPSIRSLAKEMQLGIITIKRAYDDLCAQGYAYAVQGKGVYVADIAPQKADEYHEGKLKELLTEVITFAKRNDISEERLISIAQSIWENKT